MSLSLLHNEETGNTEGIRECNVPILAGTVRGEAAMQPKVSQPPHSPCRLPGQKACSSRVAPLRSWGELSQLKQELIVNKKAWRVLSFIKFKTVISASYLWIIRRQAVPRKNKLLSAVIKMEYNGVCIHHKHHPKSRNKCTFLTYRLYLSSCPFFGKRGNITHNSRKLSNIQILF